MSNRKGDFDDDEGFFESLLNRRNDVPMPESMVKMFKMIAASAVVIIIALITWAVWPNGNHTKGDDVPIVRADTGDYKVEPEDKGGMNIPNKDSTIFETMDKTAAPEKKVENLLEDSEQPMKKEEAFVEGTPITNENPNDEPIIPKTASKTEEAPVAPPAEDLKSAEKADVAVKEESPLKAPEKEAEKEAKKEVEKVAEKAPVKAPEKAEKKVNIIDALKEEAGTAKPKPKEAVAAKPAKGSVYIQLAAVKSEADAKTKWAKLKSSYSVLNSMSLHVQKADLGAKGTFYRVQAGPVSADAASSACAKIKAAKGDCIIAK